MQIERNVELLRPLPRTASTAADHSRPLTRIVDLREAVDQRAPEAELLDAAFELGARQIGVLHRQARRSAWKRCGRLRDLLGQKIIGPARNLVGAPRVGDGLNGGSVQRQDHHLDRHARPSDAAAVLDVEQGGSFSSGQ